jgi:hypothetical protein
MSDVTDPHYSTTTHAKSNQVNRKRKTFFNVLSCYIFIIQRLLSDPSSLPSVQAVSPSIFETI